MFLYVIGGNRGQEEAGSPGSSKSGPGRLWWIPQMDQDALRLLTGWYGCTREEECVVALPVYAMLSTTDKAGCRAALHCSTAGGIAAAVKEAPSAVGTYVLCMQA